MTKYDAAWVAGEEAKRLWMAENSLYRAEDEHASCGVGLVVAINGKPSRRVVEHGIEALKAVWHRGAVDADGKTGDGAGIHVEIPDAFFYDQIERTGHNPKNDEMIAVGQVFLPRTDFRPRRRLPDHRRIRSAADGLLHLRLAPCAGERRGSGRQGQRDAARDRADPDFQLEGCRRGYLRARALRDPAADREGGDRAADERGLYLFAVVPVDHLQGDDAGRAGGRVLSRPEGSALRERVRDLSPALFDQHLPAMVAGAAVPDAGP